MKKNFIQRHMIWVSLILICFMIIPSIKDSYCVEKETPPATAQSTANDQKEQQPAKTKVVIDPGHGGYDSGSESNNGIIEKELTLKLAKKVGAVLEKNNIEVVYTRVDDSVTWPSDNADDLLARTDIANNAQAACFVSIHLNFSEVEPESISGNEIWVNYESDQNVALAEDINEAMKKLTSSQNRGIKDQATSPLSLLVYNQIPSVLIETGFLSNDQDAAYVDSEAGSDAIANAIANGILTYVAK